MRVPLHGTLASEAALMITVDVDAYPFVLQGFPKGRKEDEEIRALFERMALVAEDAIQNDTRHVVIAVGDDDFTAHERRVIAACMAAAPAAHAARVVGAFAVIESTFARGILTALRWLAPGVIPVVAASAPDEAIDLAERCLIDAGVTGPTGRLPLERAHVHARRLHGEMRGRRSSLRPPPSR
jgi:hypothetical protein